MLGAAGKILYKSLNLNANGTNRCKTKRCMSQIIRQFISSWNCALCWARNEPLFLLSSPSFHRLQIKSSSLFFLCFLCLKRINVGKFLWKINVFLIIHPRSTHAHSVRFFLFFLFIKGPFSRLLQHILAISHLLYY